MFYVKKSTYTKGFSTSQPSAAKYSTKEWHKHCPCLDNTTESQNCKGWKDH